LSERGLEGEFLPMIAYVKSYTDDSLVLKLGENGYIQILGSRYYSRTNFGID